MVYRPQFDAVVRVWYKISQFQFSVIYDALSDNCFYAMSLHQQLESISTGNTVPFAAVDFIPKELSSHCRQSNSLKLTDFRWSCQTKNNWRILQPLAIQSYQATTVTSNLETWLKTFLTLAKLSNQEYNFPPKITVHNPWKPEQNSHEIC